MGIIFPQIETQSKDVDLEASSNEKEATRISKNFSLSLIFKFLMKKKKKSPFKIFFLFFKEIIH